GRAEAELKNFSPHYRRQYSVAFFSQLHDEVEQHKTAQTQLLKQREPLEPGKPLYEEHMLHYIDEIKKWKERFVVVRANYSIECHDNYEAFVKGAQARYRLLPTGGTAVVSLDKYNALVDRAFPDPNSVSEETSPPLVTMPGPFPVFLRLPYRKDHYFCFTNEESQNHFVGILGDCIRHQNHDFLKHNTCEVQAFLKAVQFYRQEKGHYESWDMLIGSDVRVLSNLVMEELLPTLQTEMLPKLKGKKNERKRVWFATLEAAYILVQEQVSEGLNTLKDTCKETAKQLESRIRSDMDQILNSKNFLAGKLKATVSEPAVKCCTESVQPYLASILEELMGPISSGFSDVRALFENEIDALNQNFQERNNPEVLKKALEHLGEVKLHDCYQRVEVLREQLQELRNRFKYSNTSRLVHSTQNHMQQLMENVAFTLGHLLSSTLKDSSGKVPTAIEKAKQRVLKQYDYDSSTVRKKIFQEALIDITLPTIQKSLAPSCKPELQKFEQFIFADYSNFIQVENVYEEILLQTLENEVGKVVKEAASAKKHNLFVDSMDLHCVSQSSLTESKTPPGTTHASPAKQPASPAEKQPLQPEDSQSALVAEKQESEAPTTPQQGDSTAASTDTAGTEEALADNMASLGLGSAMEESPNKDALLLTAQQESVPDTAGEVTEGEKIEGKEDKTEEHPVHLEPQTPASINNIRELMAEQEDPEEENKDCEDKEPEQE
ncbi:NIBAN protein, partial [Amia calva]|nr:NIBAN protein [Amia calva]